MDEQGFSTMAIHAGFEADAATGAVNPPIYASSTFAQNKSARRTIASDGAEVRYGYARTANPTRTVLERKLAAIEDGSRARAFSSGMAAVDCVLRGLLRPGDEVVLPECGYSGTLRLLATVMGSWGIRHVAVPMDEVDAVAGVLTPRTRMVWVESPTNPLLSIVDIAAMSELARTVGATLVVDNTLASPYLQRPLQRGADVVVHSTTKYIAGHSDLLGGALVTNDVSVDDALGFLQNAAGAVPGAQDCYMVDRGIKTLPVRMERHCDNAEAIAEFLAGRDGVERVHYPGLRTHPGHDLAAGQMRRFGGMVSFELRGSAAEARSLVESTTLFALAESLGGVESLIEHPYSMTHVATAGTPLETPPGLVRLSVGLEDAGDLIRDLEKALLAVDA